jgi:hypothetical protein
VPREEARMKKKSGAETKPASPFLGKTSPRRDDSAIYASNSMFIREVLASAFSQ